MEGRTHLASGFFLFALGLGPGAIFGSLFPDIDSPRAFFGLVSDAYGHRGLFHSLSFLTIIGGIAVIAGYPGFLSGYAAHILLDSLTVSGVRMFEPFFPLRLRGPFITGGFFDHMLSAVLFASAVAVSIPF